MNINPVNNSSSFKALECINTYSVKKSLSNRAPEVLATIKKAEKQLAKTETKLTLDFTGDILVNYVDLGKTSLAFIDDAFAEGNILKVCGYTYDKSGPKLRNTRYIRVTFPLKDSKTAENFANAIKSTDCKDVSADSIAKSVIAAKAFDKSV